MRLKNSPTWPVSLNQFREFIIQAATGQDYYTFRKYSLECDYNSRRFFGISKNRYTAYSHNTVPNHPFPSIITDTVPELIHWKTVWNAQQPSSYTRPFFIPLMPKETFKGGKVCIKKFQNWPIGKEPIEFCDPYCGALYYQQDKLVGAMLLYWWGEPHGIKGMTAVVSLINDNGIPVSVSLDMRTEYEKPTFGPTISFDQGFFDSLVSQITNIPSRYKIDTPLAKPLANTKRSIPVE